MKSCSQDGCTTEIDEKYTYCYAHFQPKKTDMNARPPGQWHDDPVVSALLQLNSNCGRVAQELKRMNDRAERE